MALIVHKYGGTSMGSPERIRNVARRVAKWQKAGYQMVVVVSAMSGETNRLLALASEVSPNPDPRELDVVATTGEQVSIGLLAMALKDQGVDAVSLTGWQVGVKTDNAYMKARIDEISDERVRQELNRGRVVVVAGFQGVDGNGNITTLGRGGSDTSAVAIAAAMKADECLIFTDVDGVYTTDPRIVPEAKRLASISFEEMLELASAGSKVLQIRSVEFAGKFKVPCRVLSSLTDPDLPVEVEAVSGTLISYEDDPKMMEKALVTGIAASRSDAKVTIQNVPDTPGVASRILGPVAAANIDVDMIVQNTSVAGKTDFTFTVPRGDLQKTLDVLNNQVIPAIGAERVSTNDTIAKISLVGIGMRSHSGVASRMFKALSEENINILMISTSEIKVSLVIEDKYTELAVRVLHKAFELENGPTEI